MKKIFVLGFLSVAFFSQIQAQTTKDSMVVLPIISAGYGFYLPGGNLVERFGNNSSIVFNVDFKLNSNWIFGVNGSYLFGKKVKESLFENITKEDVFINTSGDQGDVRLYERGFTLSGTVGRIFSFSKKTPHSGVMVNMGLGFIQHKIRIEVIGNNIPQLDKEYKKGYDRLSNGFLLSQNLGYLFLSNNHLVNFYIGLECMQGFTSNRRIFDFDSMEQDTKKRMDVLTGVKLAWMLPLYRKVAKSNNYYIY